MLFADHQDLFQAFTVFLPPCIQQQARSSLPGGPAVAGAVGQKRDFGSFAVTDDRSSSTPHIVSLIGANSTVRSDLMSSSPGPSAQHLPSIPSTLGSPVVSRHGSSTAKSVRSSSGGGAGGGGEAMSEEDAKKMRAFQYVFKIRNVLASEPDTYQ